MTSDDVLAVGPEQADAITVAVTVTQMCMPEQLLAAQLAANATTFPDATEEQLADLACVLGAFGSQVDGLALDERIALQQADEPSEEALADVKASCDLSDDDLAVLQQL